MTDIWQNGYDAGKLDAERHIKSLQELRDSLLKRIDGLDGELVYYKLLAEGAMIIIPVKEVDPPMVTEPIIDLVPQVQEVVITC